jgi:hypothetical protein
MELNRPSVVDIEGGGELLCDPQADGTLPAFDRRDIGKGDVGLLGQLGLGHSRIFPSDAKRIAGMPMIPDLAKPGNVLGFRELIILIPIGA